MTLSALVILRSVLTHQALPGGEENLPTCICKVIDCIYGKNYRYI